MKLRASWGLTGRDNTAAWQWMKVYALDANRGVVFGEGTQNDSGRRITINKTNSAVNPDVHWDKSYKTNVGLDFQVLNKRLAVNIDYYYERNREMLLNLVQDIPATIGTQSAAMNLGEINNWGWEIGITWRDKIGKDFKYRVGLNTGFSDNEVLNMDFEDEYVYRQITKGSRTDIGTWGMQCIGMFRSYQEIEEYFETYMKKDDGTYGTYMGLTKTDVRPGMLIYKDVRGEKGVGGPDHKVDKDDDQVCLSKRNNPYGFTINLNAEWKGLSLTTQFNASWGGYTTLPTQAISPQGSIEYYNMPSFWNVDNMYSYSDVIAKDADGNDYYLVKANHDAYYPNMGYSINSVASSFWRISAAQVRITRLTLAYSLPKHWFSKVGIKSARINVTGQNLINFYNPYPDKFMSPMAGTYGTYPNLRSWTVGVNLSF